ncbi:MAG: RluA family pseudouridine synthase [Bradymonadales bacterium]|nr:MAG: RluA family pseudouridine synthase [Bradymonadales bacterium]
MAVGLSLVTRELIYQPLYEDQDILVIEKKKAFLSQRSDEGAQESLAEFISRVQGAQFFPVHRLDREVLGVMIFAKSAPIAEELSSQFRNRVVKKRYWAWVKGSVAPGRQHLVHYLKKNFKTNRTTVFPRPTPGAKRAELFYWKIGEKDQFSLVEVELKTGRSHQIRAQLAKVGHPILGDLRYGKPEAEALMPDSGAEKLGIQLRSKLLGLMHPVRKEWVEWEISIPQDEFF